MKSKNILFAIIVVLMFVSTGCDTTLEPAVPVAAQPPCRLDAGTSIPLIATGGQGSVTLEWSASIGDITPSQGPTVTYTAPNNYAGDVVIILTTKNGKKSVSENIMCTVNALPTATPTATPEPTATFTPLPTITSTPPPPLFEIFPQVDGGKDFVYINNGGELTPTIIPNQNCIHSGVYGLQLTYAMKEKGNGGWGVLWDNSPSKYFNASGFNAFVFWVKGAVGGEIFQVGLKDINGNEAKIESIKLVVVSRDWMKATARFSDFNGVNVASLQNVNFGFNQSHGSGSICVDDLAFVSVP